MHFRIAVRILGSLLMMFSVTLLLPIIFSYIYDDGAEDVFIRAFFITFVTGFVLWLIFHRAQAEMRIKDGFLVTVLFYLTLGTFGAIPFYAEGGIALSIPDSIFESFSGLTTTGATVLVGIDDLPKSILYYRQQLQWLGGMGIIVLAVAILPMLGIGGMQLFRAETPGPMKDSKLTPRIKHTALALWSIYVGLTIACAIAYWLAGMSWFDALCHSFSTIATGGFSTHDASIGYFNSPSIEIIAIIFMVLSGMNYGLHFFAIKARSARHYFRDDEARTFLLYLLSVTAIVAGVLWWEEFYGPGDAIRLAMFEVVSIFTTTGFATVDFTAWPNMLPFLLFFGAFAGACAGSTSGGMKIIRVMLIYKQAMREIYRLIHPKAVFPVKVNRRQMPDRVIDAVWGFFAIYTIVIVVMQIALLATGMDFITAFSAVGATINNLGPGMGEVTYNFQDITGTAKLLLCLSMILGRLEIFPLLVLFSAMFWRK